MPYIFSCCNSLSLNFSFENVHILLFKDTLAIKACFILDINQTTTVLGFLLFGFSSKSFLDYSKNC